MFKHINFLVDDYARPLLDLPNVVGFGSGFKIKNNIMTYSPTLSVFVSKKHPVESFSEDTRIPKVFHGVQTDVFETGFFKPCALTSKENPPIKCGYSIGIANEKNGFNSSTIGCLLYDLRNPNKHFIVTSNHALTNNSNLTAGVDVFHPSPQFVKKNLCVKIGTVYEFCPILQNTTEANGNIIDAALVELSSTKVINSFIMYSGPPQGVNINFKASEKVKMTGVTSGLSRGNIISPNATITYKEPDPNDKKKEIKTIFIKQIVTTHMAEEGDSGAVLLDLDNKVIGLLMASSPSSSTFNPFADVLRYFNVGLTIEEL